MDYSYCPITFYNLNKAQELNMTKIDIICIFVLNIAIGFLPKRLKIESVYVKLYI